MPRKAKEPNIPKWMITPVDHWDRSIMKDFIIEQNSHIAGRRRRTNLFTVHEIAKFAYIQPNSETFSILSEVYNNIYNTQEETQ